MDIAYERLAAAIVEQAAKDYRAATRKLKREPGHEPAIQRIKEVERFIRSDWFKCLTDIDPNAMLKTLKAFGGSAPKRKTRAMYDAIADW